MIESNPKRREISRLYNMKLHLTLSSLTPDTKITETDLLDWRLRLIFHVDGIRTLRQLSEYPKSHFEGRFLSNEKAIRDMTLFLNYVGLEWNTDR